ncbi:sperm-associated microtubule inner protein 10-like isoform X2 [Styela clava]
MAKTNAQVQTEVTQRAHIIQHMPSFSRLHPIIPKRYVPEWKTDMVNRTRLIKNAKQAGIYPGPHDESLFLEKRERLNHGEKRGYVVVKTTAAPRRELLRPPFPSHMSKYQSELMYRRDPWEED